MTSLTLLREIIRVNPCMHTRHTSSAFPAPVGCVGGPDARLLAGGSVDGVTPARLSAVRRQVTVPCGGQGVRSMHMLMLLRCVPLWAVGACCRSRRRLIYAILHGGCSPIAMRRAVAALCPRALPFSSYCEHSRRNDVADHVAPVDLGCVTLGVANSAYDRHAFWADSG